MGNSKDQMRDTMDGGGKRKSVSQSVDRERRSAIRWYGFSFVLLGGLVGYLAGASQSPVIGVLLPLLFGLMGGAGGLYLARVELTKPEAVLRLRVLGKVLALFVISVVLGSFYGISLRTGQSIWGFFSSQAFLPEARLNLPSLVGENPKEAVELVLLRARLRALGASSDEEQTILLRAAKLMETADCTSDIPASLRRVAALATKSRDVLIAGNGTSEDEPSDLRNFLWTLYGYAASYEDCAKRVENGERVPLSLAQQRINSLRIEVTKFLSPTRVWVWLSQLKNAREVLWELQLALINEQEKLGSPAWIEGGLLTEEMDRLISIAYGRSKVATENGSLWRPPPRALRE